MGYLPKVARKLHTESAPFVEAFYEEFAPYLSRGSYPGFEIDPQSLDLKKGESQEVSVDIYPNEPGHMMFGIAAVRKKTVISVSDLVGLSVRKDGNVYLDF
jgi:hypothetical protein